MGKRVADMTPEELERKRARDRVESMTPEQLELKRARNHIAGRRENMAPKQLERARARCRAENMTPEQLEQYRTYHRKENMTPEQLELRRSRDRVENLTPEQLELKRAKSAEKKARNATDLEVFMLNKIDLATRSLNFTYRIPSTCPPELAAKLAPVLEMLKTADAAQRAVIRGVVRAMRAARELELAESVAQ